VLEASPVERAQAVLVQLLGADNPVAFIVVSALIVRRRDLG